ncbi:MAG: hypothetical protein DMF56_14610 [Acidobacteria bacterium]|nr:MAG: hypothetical protein DMF56_14610 [Acidobacteriota bacterium]
MSGETTARVHYFDKQFLRVDEFRDEQLYQLALRRRHNNAQHTWGIVRGLEIRISDQSIVVQPGMAIDGYGRELLLTEEKTVAPESFDDLASDRLDLWLVYERKDDGSTPEGYGECGVEGGGASYRSNESPELRIERPLSNTVDARKPPRVPREVLEARVPPISDDPLDRWRVYLGRVIRLEKDKYLPDMTSRPYVGVVAESIDHPQSAARVELGRESTVEHVRQIGEVAYHYTADGHRRFGVFVPDDLIPTTAERVDLLPRIEVLDSGEIGLRGSTVIHGNLQLSGGALQFVHGTNFEEEEAPQEPSMYRFTGAGIDELRIDLGVDSEQRKFVIGFSSPDGKFKPCITIALEPDKDAVLQPVVTIDGDLMINGKFAGQILPVAISAEAMAALSASFQMGLAEGNNP